MAETLQERQQRFLERDIERKAKEQQLMEGVPALLPKAAWMAWLMAPSSGITDYAGLYPEVPTGEGITGEKLPSFVENIRNKEYLDALYQSLGLAGDVAYASTPLTGGVGLLAGTALKGAGAAGKASKAKGIASLADKKELVKAIKEKQRQAVRKYATDEGGDDTFISPTLEALIKRAPQNLKGKQISQWLDANANKGVKPKELEYLGIDEYIANNPNAKVSEVVEGVSENKVKIRKNYFEDDTDYRPTIDFETSTPDTDPLDGSSLWGNDIDNIKYDIDQGDEFAKEDLLDFANNRYVYNRYERVRTRSEPFTSIDDLEWHLGQIDDSFSDIDDVIEGLAEQRYRDNPYELIEPVSTGDIDANIGDKTFAFGNEETGYSIFVDGRRIDLTTTRGGRTVDNTPYSRTEAQIELRNAMEEGGDPLRIEGEYDPYDYGNLHKIHVDENLPGGRNYREVSFSWANAPKGHNIGHIDDENQVAHALVRDRVLDDGTDTLHIDELQSDLHKEGSKHGYELPESVKKETVNKVNGLLEGTPYSYFEQGTGSHPFKGIIIPNKSRMGAPIYDASQQRLLEGHDFISFEELLEALKDPVTGEMNLIDASRGTYAVLENLGLDNVKELVKNAKPFIGEGKVPNYPFKDDWYNTGLKSLLFDAVRDGKDALSISTSAAMKGRYTDRYHKFYESLYDQKIPSAMKKLAKKYGGEFRKGSLDMADTFGSPSGGYKAHGDLDYTLEQGIENVKSNIIKITPKMREKIIAEGLPSFGYRSGGMVDKAITGGSRYI